MVTHINFKIMKNLNNRTTGLISKRLENKKMAMAKKPLDVSNVKYKKTLSEINKLGGVEYSIFDGMMWKLFYVQFTHKGRVYESVKKLPIYQINSL